MAAGALDVLVRFVGDSSSLRSEAAKVEGTGGKIKTWAKGIGAAVGGAFAITAVKEFIGAASELQDQVGATQQIFGKAANQVIAFGEGAADAFGMSNAEALQAANTVAAFGKGAGLAGSDLAGFSTKLVGLAGDLASFRGTSPEQAIEAVGAALRGESEPIRAYGVLLDAATLKARALSMGLVKSSADVTKVKQAQLAGQRAFIAYNKAVEKHGKDSVEASLAQQQLTIAQDKLKAATAGTVPDLTQQQKVLAANAEIFAQTGDAQGDFARTSESAANQQKKLKADVENMQAALGGALLPIMQKILPVLQSMAEFFADNAAALVPLTIALGAFIVMLKLATLVQTAFGISAMAAFAWIFIVIAAIAALIAIGYLLVRNWDTIKAVAAAVWRAMQTAWDAILNAVKAAFNWIKQNWPLLLGILTGPVGLAVALIVRHWDAVKAAIAAVWSWIKSTWSSLLGILTAPFSAAWQTISGIIGSIRGAISSALTFAGDQAGRIAGALRGAINAVIRAWNAIEFKVPEVKVGPISFGGQTIGLPDIPQLAGGGYISRTGMAVVHRGETVQPAGSGGTVNVTVQVPPTANPYQVGRAVVDAIRAYEGVAGTSWRMSPSGRSA